MSDRWEPMRKPVATFIDGDSPVVVCDDGAVFQWGPHWVRDTEAGGEKCVLSWSERHPIPGSFRADTWAKYDEHGYKRPAVHPADRPAA